MPLKEDIIKPNIIKFKKLLVNSPKEDRRWMNVNFMRGPNCFIHSILTVFLNTQNKAKRSQNKLA
jgi:hypothetical protein